MGQTALELLAVENLLIVIFFLAIVCGLLVLFVLSFHKRLVETHIKLAAANGKVEALGQALDTVRNDLLDDEVDSLREMIEEVTAMQSISKRKFISLIQDRMEVIR